MNLLGDRRRIDEPTTSVSGHSGVTLAVSDTGGTSRPIVFIHGLSQSRLLWARQFDSFLADRFRLVAFDLRGHGDSEKPPDGYRDRTIWAGDVRAVLDQLELERPLVVAWSYGGLVACDYLHTFGSDDLGGLVFIGAATRIGVPGAGEDVLPDAVPEGITSSVEAEAGSSVEAFVRTLTCRPLPPSEFAFILGCNAQCPSRVRDALLDRSYDNDEVLAGIRCPVMLLHGERDVSIAPPASQRVAGIIPAAAHITYPATGHCPFWEQSVRVNTDLAKFADGLPIR